MSTARTEPSGSRPQLLERELVGIAAPESCHPHDPPSIMRPIMVQSASKKRTQLSRAQLSAALRIATDCPVRAYARSIRLKVDQRWRKMSV
jgi:hypothetical protein